MTEQCMPMNWDPSPVRQGIAVIGTYNSVGISAAASTPDGREGIAAFVEKRAPRFGAGSI